MDTLYKPNTQSVEEMLLSIDRKLDRLLAVKPKAFRYQKKGSKWTEFYKEFREAPIGHAIQCTISYKPNQAGAALQSKFGPGCYSVRKTDNGIIAIKLKEVA